MLCCRIDFALSANIQTVVLVFVIFTTVFIIGRTRYTVPAAGTVSDAAPSATLVSISTKIRLFAATVCCMPRTLNVGHAIPEDSMVLPLALVCKLPSFFFSAGWQLPKEFDDIFG